MNASWAGGDPPPPRLSPTRRRQPSSRASPTGRESTIAADATLAALHRLDPRERAAHAARGRGGRGRDGGHDPEPVQGAHGEARGQDRAVVTPGGSRPTPT